MLSQVATEELRRSWESAYEVESFAVNGPAPVAMTTSRRALALAETIGRGMFFLTHGGSGGSQSRYFLIAFTNALSVLHQVSLRVAAAWCSAGPSAGAGRHRGEDARREGRIVRRRAWTILGASYERMDL